MNVTSERTSLFYCVSCVSYVVHTLSTSADFWNTECVVELTHQTIISIGLPTHPEGVQVATAFEMRLMGVGHPGTEMELNMRCAVFEPCRCI
jgi:hypothetical protein